MGAGQPADLQLIVAVLVAQGGLLLLFLCHMWLLLCRPGAQPSCGDIGAGLRRQAQHCNPCSKHATVGAVSMAVMEKLEQMRLQQGFRAVRVIVHWFAPVGVAYHAWQAATDPTAQFTVDFLIWISGHFLAYSVGLLMTYGMIEMTPRRLDLIFVLTMVDGLWLAFSLDLEELVVSNGWGIAFQMFFVSVYMDCWKALPWQLATSILKCHRVCNGPAPHGQRFVVYELSACALVVGLSYVLRQWAESHCRVQVAVESQKSAAMTLLGFQSEAVFWLDHSLRIRGPAPQLAGLLMLGNIPGQLAGNEFQHYIASEEDRQRFRDFVAASFSNRQLDGPPAAVHVSLRDAFNTTFTVEVFHVYCMDDEDRFGHLVGIMAGDRDRAADRVQEEPRRRTRRAGAPRCQPSLAPAADPPRGAPVPTVVGASGADQPGPREGRDTEHGGRGLDFEAAPGPQNNDRQVPSEGSDGEDDGRGLGFGRPHDADPQVPREYSDNSDDGRGLGFGRPRDNDRPVPRAESDDVYEGRGLGFGRPRDNVRPVPREESDDEYDGRGLGLALAPRPRGSENTASAGAEVAEGGGTFDWVVAAAAGEEQDNEAASVSAASAASYESVSFLPRFRQGSAPAPFCVLYDPWAGELVACTDGLCALIGPLLAGEAIGDLIANPDEFCVWAQQCANEATHGEHTCETIQVESSRSDSRHCETVVFQATAAIIQVFKKKRPSALGVEHSGTDPEQKREMLCIVEFQGLRAKRKKKKAANTRPGIQTVSTFPSSGRIGTMWL